MSRRVQDNRPSSAGAYGGPANLSDAAGAFAAMRYEALSSTNVFDLVTSLATAVVPDACGATLALSHAGASDSLAIVAASDPKLRVLDARGGPYTTLSAGGAQRTLGGDFSAWPDFVGEAKRLGVRDAIVHRLALENSEAGYLSVYSEGVFDQQAVVSVEVFCLHAAAVVTNTLAFNRLSRVNAQLEDGLQSREVIGLAKGILMRQEHCSEADAFRIIVQASQRLNHKVRDVAQHVVALAEGRTTLAGGSDE